MKKILKKIANGGLGILFTKEEQSTNNYEEGDILDLDDVILIKKKEVSDAKE